MLQLEARETKANTMLRGGRNYEAKHSLTANQHLQGLVSTLYALIHDPLTRSGPLD